jgi:hypothetical protein
MLVRKADEPFEVCNECHFLKNQFQRLLNKSGVFVVCCFCCFRKKEQKYNKMARETRYSFKDLVETYRMLFGGAEDVKDSLVMKPGQATMVLASLKERNVSTLNPYVYERDKRLVSEGPSVSTLLDAVRECNDMENIKQMAKFERCLKVEKCSKVGVHRTIDLALQLAVDRQLWSVVKVLIREGANANFKEWQVSNSLVNMAVLNQDLFTLQELVEGGGDIKARTADSINSLEEILYLTVIDMDVLHYLLQKGCRLPGPVDDFKTYYPKQPNEIWQYIKLFQV